MYCAERELDFPWLLAGEAVNVSSGLGYNGVDEKGKAQWNLVDNADILQIEVLAVFIVFVSVNLIIINLNVHTDFSRSNRQHLSYDYRVEVRMEHNQNCSVLCCISQLCIMICTHKCTVFKFACRFRF